MDKPVSIDFLIDLLAGSKHFLKACWLLVFACATFAQAPLAQPQPAGPTYSTDVISLFPQYTRDSYRAATGTPAPACDPAKPLKTWFDLSAKGRGTVTYTALNSSFDASLQSSPLMNFSLSDGDAASVNLPGAEPTNFAPFVVAPTTATMKIGSTILPLSPNRLSTPAEASLVAHQLGAGAPKLLTTTGLITYNYGTDARGIWQVSFNGATYDVGALLPQMYAKGVGYPGSWSLTSAGAVWTPAAISDCSAVTATIPAPVRALFPNEKFSMGLAGMIPVLQITRTDMAGPGGSASSAGFTEGDRALLTAIQAALFKVLTTLGVQ